MTLHGLVLVARRKVSYGRIDPARASEVFIEGALVAGEFDAPHPFWAHNRRLIREIEELEHRARRPDVLVDDRALFAFYDARMPKDVRDVRSLDAWYRAASAGEPKLLFLAREDLMRHGAESVTEELFPRQLRIGEAAFPLAYRFEPGHPMDGVTMTVPLALLNQVDEAAHRLARARDDPRKGGLDDEGAAQAHAHPARARAGARDEVPRGDDVALDAATRRWSGAGAHGEGRGARVRLADRRRAPRRRLWSKEEPPAHLRMNVRVVDEAKRELAMGRDLGELRKRLGEAASLTLAQSKPGMEREGIAAWDFGELPAQVTFRRGGQTLTGYPALTPSPGEGRGEGQSVRSASSIRARRPTKRTARA